jgi:hypothetical protein
MVRLEQKRAGYLTSLALCCVTRYRHIKRFSTPTYSGRGGYRRVTTEDYL